ncbi:MAG: DUF998 domain-containing protein [Anaerolineales bacterium]|nr:DUF998 domain-containing protein [Anaerolineales bacterium]
MAGIKLKPAVWYGATLFCVVILVAGYLTPNYSHIKQAISELGAPNAPYDWAVRGLGFVPLGMSFILYAFQSRKLFSNNLPFYLFLLTGLAIIMAGVFPTDPKGRRDTAAGILHAVAGIILLVLLSITPLVMSFNRVYQNPPKKWLLMFSFVMGVLVAVFFVMLPNGISPQLVSFHQKVLGDYFEVWYPMHGLHQRFLLFLYFIWLFIFSYFENIYPLMPQVEKQ